MKANDARGRLFALSCDLQGEFDTHAAAYLAARIEQEARWKALCRLFREIEKARAGLGDSMPDLIEHKEFFEDMGAALRKAGVSPAAGDS